MTIKRTINGNEMSFDLTSTELYRAFLEQEHQFDLEDVKTFVDEWSDEDFMSELHITRGQFFDVIDAIAYRRRNYIRDYEMFGVSATDLAIHDVLQEVYTGAPLSTLAYSGLMIGNH